MKIGNSNYRRLIAKVALLGLLAVCGGASPAHAQETVAGKFSLSESVRLGGKMLPAGAYTFTIEPAGQSAGAIVGNHRNLRQRVEDLQDSRGQQAGAHTRW